MVLVDRDRQWLKARTGLDIVETGRELAFCDQVVTSNAALAEHSARTGESYEFEHRLLRTDGEERLILARGRMQHDPDGRPFRLIGTRQDITDLRRS